MGNRRKKIHGRANHANTQGGGGVEQRFGYAAQVTIRRITAGRLNTAEWTQRAYKDFESSSARTRS